MVFLTFEHPTVLQVFNSTADTPTEGAGMSGLDMGSVEAGRVALPVGGLQVVLTLDLNPGEGNK
jgi:hypothetical protein